MRLDRNLSLSLLRSILCLALGLLGACTGRPEPPQPAVAANVVLITIDTLRADYVSAYRARPGLTPALDSLADDGVLFENAYCQAPMTPPSHASILTGAYPATHGLRDFTSGTLAPGLPTMATILREKGYATAAFVSAFVLDRSWGLNAGFQVYFDSFEAADFENVNPGNVQRRADQTIDQVLAWLKTAPEPYYLWVHLFDPHHDYNPPEPFKSLHSGDPYAGEVAYTDSQIARLIGELKENGQYPRTLIIATSDHGEGLGEHGEKEHGFFLYEGVTRVPLIFKLPATLDVIGKRLTTVVQSVDILPTALQALGWGIHDSPGIEGRSLLPEITGESLLEGFAFAETRYPRTTFGWSPLRLYREGNFKLIEAPQPELYDVAKDTHEVNNLFAAQPELAERLRNRLQVLESSSAGAPAAAATSPDQEERIKRLASLGYVSISQPHQDSDIEGLADPKEKIGIYNRILEGLQAAEAGQLERSNDILEKIAGENPQLFILQHQIGTNLLRLGEPRKALDALRRAHDLNPDFSATEVNFARALARVGRLDEAIEMLEQTVAAKPHSDLPLRRQLASLYSQKGRFAEARDLGRKLLQERPDDLQTLRFLGFSEVETKEYQAGLQTLDRAIELGLDDALIRNARGIALVNLGRRPEAIESYRRATRLNPEYGPAHLNLALTLLQDGRRDEALSTFQQLCRTNRPLCERYRQRFQ